MRRMLESLVIAGGLVLAAAAAPVTAQTVQVHVAGLKAPAKLLALPAGELLVAEAGEGPNTGRISFVDRDARRFTVVDGLPSARVTRSPIRRCRRRSSARYWSWSSQTPLASSHSATLCSGLSTTYWRPTAPCISTMRPVRRCGCHASSTSPATCRNRVLTSRVTCGFQVPTVWSAARLGWQ